MMLSGLPKCFS